MAKLVEDDLIAVVEKMPAFPRSVHKVIRLAADMDSSAKEIVAVIENDPVMTLKILKVINSAFYSLPQKITTIQRALVYMGTNTLKNLALSVAAIGVLSSHNKAGFDTQLFLQHSLAVAVLSKRLAERQGVSAVHSSDYFVAGLLHDFGKIVFAEFLPTEFKSALQLSAQESIALYEAEHACIGLSHAQAGRILALKWQLSEDLAQAIACHHDTEGGGLLGTCVYAANQIAQRCAIGFAGNSGREPFAAGRSVIFGLSLDELIAELGDLSVVRTEVQQFIGG